MPWKQELALFQSRIPSFFQGGVERNGGVEQGPCLSLLCLCCPCLNIHSESESQEEIIQNIARQLAQIGDRMDSSIPSRVVNNLAMEFMNVNLSEEVSEKTL